MSIPHIDKRNWFVLGKVDDFDRVTRCTIYETHYLVIKSKSSFFVTLDRCPHRGYPLSASKNLTCAYHGWKFNNDGELIEIPGLKICPNIKLKKFESHVFNGYLWINLGEKKFPNISLIPNKYGCIHYKFEIEAPSYLLIENTLDPTHTAYVHKGLVRNTNSKQVNIEITGREEFVEALYLNEGQQSGIISKLFGSNEDVGLGRYIHPGIIQLEYRDKKNIKALMQAYLQPLSNNTTRAFLEIEYTRHPMVFLKPLFAWFLKKVLLQDKFVVEKQFSNLVNDDSFVSTELDFLAKPLRALINEEKIDIDEKISLRI